MLLHYGLVVTTDWSLRAASHKAYGNNSGGKWLRCERQETRLPGPGMSAIGTQEESVQRPPRQSSHLLIKQKPCVQEDHQTAHQLSMGNCNAIQCKHDKILGVELKLVQLHADSYSRQTLGQYHKIIICLQRVKMYSWALSMYPMKLDDLIQWFYADIKEERWENQALRHPTLQGTRVWPLDSATCHFLDGLNKPRVVRNTSDWGHSHKDQLP